MFVSVAGVTAAENPSDRVSLWDERVPYPSRESLSHPRSATDVMVHRASGKYNFLHDANIVAHKGKLLAAWYNCPRGEMVGESVIRGRWSTDRGQTWSDVEVIADRHNGHWGDQKGIMYVPIALRSYRGTLYGFVTNMKHGPDLVHKCEVFALDDQTGAWASRGFIAGPFLPNCPPKAMEGGNFIMAGRMAETPGQKPRIPAVAVSTGDEFTKPWTVHSLLPQGKLPDGRTMTCPETTVFVEGKEITALIRHTAGNSLVVFSHDFGRSWSKPHRHNIPMKNSKIWAGRLSTGQRYLIFNYHPADGRDLLVVTVTAPGEKLFSRMWKIREGYCEALEAGPQWSYPCAIEYESKLYVVYTSEKHHCALTTIPVASLAADQHQVPAGQ